MEKLITKNLILRKAKYDDLNYIWNNIWNDEKISEMMLWEPTKTLKDAKERLDRTIQY